MATELHKNIPHQGSVHAAIQLAAAKAAPVYQLLGWHWRDTGRAPSSNEIEETLVRLVNSTWESKDNLTVASSGRLWVQRDGSSFDIHLEIADSHEFAPEEA